MTRKTPENWWAHLLGAMLLIGTAWVAGTAQAVVPATSPRDAGPTVNTSVSAPGWTPRTVALLPFADAPRTPGSGRLATDAIRAALQSRGMQVVETSLPEDASGAPTPASLVGEPRLTRIGAEMGMQAIVAGGTLELYEEERGRPYTVVRRQGNYLEVPEEYHTEIRVSISFRVVRVENGRLVFSASGRYGPARDIPPAEAARVVVEAMLERWIEAVN